MIGQENSGRPLNQSGATRSRAFLALQASLIGSYRHSIEMRFYLYHRPKLFRKNSYEYNKRLDALIHLFTGDEQGGVFLRLSSGSLCHSSGVGQTASESPVFSVVGITFPSTYCRPTWRLYSPLQWQSGL